MSVSASREAFDLFNKACRNNFRFKLKYNWNKLWWWKVVIADTWNRVCSARQIKEKEK
jgi:hypothetical protein